MRPIHEYEQKELKEDYLYFRRGVKPLFKDFSSHEFYPLNYTKRFCNIQDEIVREKNIPLSPSPHIPGHDPEGARPLTGIPLELHNPGQDCVSVSSSGKCPKSSTYIKGLWILNHVYKALGTTYAMEALNLELLS